ncbi:MAG TPA: ABC transporter permease [Edaphobacter sp.]|nr:ABC transporter permease [Edaphobacter sp.]
MHSMMQNLRYALRQLAKSPGFTFTVVLTLALGIGATAAIFTLFDQVLLRMLPVQQPQQLVRFEWTGDFSGSASSFGGGIHSYFSYPMYKDLRDKNQVFSGMLAADRTNVGVNWNNQAENSEAEIVTGNYFDLLGLRPALGRLFTQQDDTAKNANPQVVLSYAYWKARFNASPAVIGQTVRINGSPFTIVGVAPETFQTAIGGYKPGVFIPMSMSEIAMPWMVPRHNLDNHQSLWLTLIARRKPGVTNQQVEASLAPLWHSLRAEELTLYKNRTRHFSEGFLDKSHLLVKDDSRGFSPDRGDLKTPLILLMSMAGLLVAMCAINVATLLLLRAAARAREMSMRYALGASRARIISQLFVEGGLLGLGGALAGLAIAPLVANALVHLLVQADPGSEPYSAAIDMRVFAFTLGISIVVSLLFSLAPVLHFMRPDLAESLRQSTGTASKGSQRFRKIAVGVQIALSVLLLGGAGLFVRTLDNLRSQSVGFDITRLATFNLDPTSSGYGEDRTPQVVTSAIDAVGRIPGVSSVAATTDPELSGDSNTDGFSVEGHKFAEDENSGAESPWITAGYFATLRQPLLAGREITVADSKTNTKVAVVNLAFAKHFFGSPQNALGRMISDHTGADAKLDTAIVGVVGDTHHTDLRTELGPAVYRPYLQNEHPTGVQIYVRTTQSPEAAESSIRRAIHDLDPTLVVDGLRTMEAQTAIVSSGEQALAVLAVGFSILALILAAVGLYGVLAYSTEQRTREIGVRLALGAPRTSIVVAVLREMALIAAIATVIALPSVGLLAHYFRSQLYGVSVYDPLTLAASTALILITVLLAAALPARRAAGVQPMQALRTE